MIGTVNLIKSAIKRDVAGTVGSYKPHANICD